MKSEWVFTTLTSRFPSCFASLLTQGIRFANTVTYVLKYSDTSMFLAICGREGYAHLASSLHASIIKNPLFFEPDVFDFREVALAIWNSLLFAYCNCGMLRNAGKLFEEMPIRDTVSWNVKISGLLRNGGVEAGIGLFKRMLESDSCSLDQATLTTVLSVFNNSEFSLVNKMIHGVAVSSGFESEISVGNALMTSYFKCGCPSSGRQVFNEMVLRNVVSWTAVIYGLAQSHLYEESLKMFMQMRWGTVNPNKLTYLSTMIACSGMRALEAGKQIHALLCKLGIQSDNCIECALMDMYTKCGMVVDAWYVFESADDLDQVSMTVILVGLAQNGFEEEALQFFMRMLRARVKVDANTISAVLGVFGVDTSLVVGKQLHGLAIKRGFVSNPFINNGLINMYSKCGILDDSIKIFSRMLVKNSVSWNSMIAAFARHGKGFLSLKLYKEMVNQGNTPTDVTFLSLFHACSHIGLIAQGIQLFNCMVQFYKIQPRAEHYACIVDMLGRAGLLHEARLFVEAMPSKPDPLVWQALLGACSFHGETDAGKYAAEKLFVEAPGTASPYVLMANIYSSKGRWKERAETIKRKNEAGVAKGTGISWIESGKKIHRFVVEDKVHPEFERIYQLLGELFTAMVDEGYKPDKRYILYYLNEEEEVSR